MRPPAAVTSRLSLRLRNLLAIVVAVVGLFAGAVGAQQRGPRPALPETPFCYDDRLPGVSMAVGCGGIQPSAETLARQRRLRDHRATLGRVLFYDRRLSKNGKRSCGSCHQQALGFADGQARSRGFRGKRTRRNSMPIVNLAYHKGPLFWDGRAAKLEQMVLMPIEDDLEMGHDVDEVLRVLRRDPDYVALFDRAFESRYIDRERLGIALATFVRALVSHRSRYDDGLAAANGDVKQPFANFTASENRGKALFFGTGGGDSCAACHVGRVDGRCGSYIPGTPQVFAHDGLRNNGLPDRGGRRDRGHAAVSGRDADVRRFRAPSLRNVAVTGPYMHDGRFRTLAEVVDFYARGVRNGKTLDPLLRRSESGGSWGGRSGGATLPMLGGALHSPASPVSLGFPMDTRARRDLVAFLETLTDESFLRDPRFSDPFVR
ncbi:MAG: cytochrome-c peroxidase [Planctomycetota bacterium]